MPFGTVTLNDGTEMPTIAFGTGTALFRRDVTQFVQQAIDAGFSHIDTAQMYLTEETVGKAIQESGLPRSDLYVTSKYASGEIQSSVRESLDKLKLNYLDLYLIHFPHFVPDLEAGWKEFEKIKDAGLAKSVGVSNFNLAQLQTLVKSARILPAVNQISFNPYNYAQSKDLLAYSAKHGIVTEAYSSLACVRYFQRIRTLNGLRSPITKTPGGPVDAPVAAAAKRLGITPTQVILLWVKSKGVVIVTTTSNKSRLEEYLAVGDLPPLTEEEIAAIDEAGAKGPPSALVKRGKTAFKSRASVAGLAITLLFLVYLTRLMACYQVKAAL
ncbi:NADP-dependent oxidoreductase domain-containing protein [Mycena maculata]|uniref:NADP-dependent oxidoreductase domain-containing protein n=1 Tax=Mycena maculata TaxID=230809 RepID=A0AAD7J6Y9_9AGAR|nr:NADP-dependent oxidoreductase domain-containing protein [Mycena maculata]